MSGSDGTRFTTQLSKLERSPGVLVNHATWQRQLFGNVTKLHGVPFFSVFAPMGAFSVKNGTRCIFATFLRAACRALAFHRHASDFHNFYVETSQTFTIRRPRICLNFEFMLRKSSRWSPPVSPRQRCGFCLRTRLPRAASRCCTPSNAQKHFLYVCLLAQLIR